ncbi:hypothetical protein GN956_G25686 [Arapaima gigas]
MIVFCCDAEDPVSKVAVRLQESYLLPSSRRGGNNRKLTEQNPALPSIRVTDCRHVYPCFACERICSNSEV